MGLMFNNISPTHIVLIGKFDENFKWIPLFTVPCSSLANAEKYKQEYENYCECSTQAVIVELP